MKRNIRFRKMWNSFVTLTIWEMESPVISWIFTVHEIMKENFQSCLTCTEAVFSLGKKKRDFLPSYIYGKHWKKSSFYPYINPENKEIIRNLPPSFLVTAYGDTLRNYSRQYAKAIKKAGVICHLEDYEVDKKLPHAFSTTFPEMEESKRANTQMVEFLFKY